MFFIGIGSKPMIPVSVKGKENLLGFDHVINHIYNIKCNEDREEPNRTLPWIMFVAQINCNNIKNTNRMRMVLPKGFGLSKIL